MKALTQRVGHDLNTVRALLGVVRDRPNDDAVRRAADVLGRCGHSAGEERWERFAARLRTTRGESLAALIDAILAEIAAPMLAADVAAGDVLVVEADGAMGSLLALALDEPGRELTFVGSASEARAALSAGDFDAVVAAVDLGGEDARDLVAWMRRSTRHELVPVILSTVEGSDVAECYALGADAVLEQPVGTDVLAASVHRLVRRSRRERALRHVDPSTGLLNEDGLRVAFERARAASARSQVPMAFGILDVAPRADIEREMCDLARRAGHTLRKADVLGRLGPTSIAVIMPGADAMAGRRALSRTAKRMTGSEDPRIAADAVRPTDSWQTALARVTR